MSGISKSHFHLRLGESWFTYTSKIGVYSLTVDDIVKRTIVPDDNEIFVPMTPKKKPEPAPRVIPDFPARALDYRDAPEPPVLEWPQTG